MSKYTTEVRYICENYAGLLESKGYEKVDEIIESARSKIFDFSYPIFDESYRGVLECKILKHYYTMEIGAETVGLWKLWLNTRMNEIMPYYNKLYESELLHFNPLYDVDLTKKHEVKKDGTKEDTGETAGTAKTNEKSTRTETGTMTETNTSNSTRNNYYSDTPQGSIGNLETHTYLTNATVDQNNGQESASLQNTNSAENANNGSTETSGTSKISSIIKDTETYLENINGKNGGTSYSKMLEEYRATFLNIDMQVINELSDLFMSLW